MQKINFKNLPDTTTPINSTNLNKLQDNIEDCIDELHTYSSDEQLIGFWESTDGTKLPLYRKKISTTTPATAGSTSDIVTLPDDCEILLFDGYVYDGGQRLPLNFYLGPDNYYYSYPYLNKFRMKLSNENRINKDCTIILTYIKTTDTSITLSEE